MPPLAEPQKTQTTTYKPLKLTNINKKAGINDSAAYCNSPATPPTTPMTPLPFTTTTPPSTTTGSIGPGGRLWRRLQTPSRKRGERKHVAKVHAVGSDHQTQPETVPNVPSVGAGPGTGRTIGGGGVGGRGGSMIIKRRGTNATNKNVTNICGRSRIRGVVGSVNGGVGSVSTRQRRISKGGVRPGAVKVRINAIVPAGTTAEEAEEAARIRSVLDEDTGERSPAGGDGDGGITGNNNSTPTPTPGSSPTARDGVNGREPVGGSERVEIVVGKEKNDFKSGPTQGEKEKQGEGRRQAEESDEGDFLTNPTRLVQMAAGKKRMLVSRGVTMENAEVVGAELLLVNGHFVGAADVTTLSVEEG